MRELLLVLVVGLPGCFAIVQSGTQQVVVESTPPGARVVFGQDHGVTPCTFDLPRSSQWRMIRFELEGHAPLLKEIEPGSWTGLGPGLALGFDVLASICLFPLSFPIVVDVVFSESFSSWPTKVRADFSKAEGAYVWIERED